MTAKILCVIADESQKTEICVYALVLGKKVYDINFFFSFSILQFIYIPHENLRSKNFFSNFPHLTKNGRGTLKKKTFSLSYRLLKKIAKKFPTFFMIPQFL